MSVISDNQAQVTTLINYHRKRASEAIADIKEAAERRSVVDAMRRLKEFRNHSNDLRSEIEASREELAAADTWVERECSRVVDPLVNGKAKK